MVPHSAGRRCSLARLLTCLVIPRSPARLLAYPTHPPTPPPFSLSLFSPTLSRLRFPLSIQKEKTLDLVLRLRGGVKSSSDYSDDEAGVREWLDDNSLSAIADDLVNAGAVTITILLALQPEDKVRGHKAANPRWLRPTRVVSV